MGASRMSMRIVLVRFKLNIPYQEYERIVTPLVSTILEAAGLRWTIWLIHATRTEAGGIYLFDDEPSGQRFLASPMLSELMDHPAVTDVCVEHFEIMAKPTVLMHGPIHSGMRV